MDYSIIGPHILNQDFLKAMPCILRWIVKQGSKEAGSPNLLQLNLY
jgi:hypothetical protein